MYSKIAGMTVQQQPGGKTGMPRWVKVFLLIGLALVVLIVVMLLTGHGPGRHMNHSQQSPARSPLQAASAPDTLR